MTSPGQVEGDSTERELGVEYWPGLSLTSRPNLWVSACAPLSGNRLVAAIYSFHELLVLDAESGRELNRLPGFQGVRGLVSVGNDLVAVSEPERERFSLIDAQGRIQRRYAVPGIRPWHTARWGEQWLIVDADARRIHLFSEANGSVEPFISEQRMKDPRSAFPVSPETFVYCDRGRNVIAEIDRAGKWRWTHGRLGFPGNDEDCVASPESVLPLATGGQIICDTRNNRVTRRFPNGTIQIISGASGEVGSVPGCLNAPVCACVTSDGAILVADAGNGRIVRFTSDGGERTIWGRPSVRRLSFHFPRCMEPINSGWLVADSYNNRVVEIDRAGLVRSTFGEAGGQRFLWPRFATEIDSQWILCDSRGGRILRGRTGHELAPLCLQDNGRPIRMSDPHVVRKSGTGLTISDTDACRLVYCTNEGEIIRAWGGDPHSSAQSTPIPGQIRIDVGDLHDGFLAPDETIWIVDTANHRLLNLDWNGRILRKIQQLQVSRPGIADTLAWPRSAELIGPDCLLVTDSGHHRVLLLTLNGVLLGLFGGNRGHAYGHLSDPRFSRFHQGSVLITDYQNHRLVIVPLSRMLSTTGRYE